jgi:hypothetical protein
MSRLMYGPGLCLMALLLMSTGTVNAATLYVNCAGKTGLTSIGAALKALQYSEGHGPSTINVSGACHENIGKNRLNTDPDFTTIKTIIF